MSAALVRDLIDAGIHFGHRASRWNPKMAPYIFGKRNLIHIINIKETMKGLLRAKKFLSRTVAEGHDILFVGTKRQAREAVQRQAKRCNMHFVTERWLGGTLTNFRTIRSRLARLEELEALEASGQIEQYSKKMKATLHREKRKIQRNLEGVRNMNRLPGAVVVVDARREHIAVAEAVKLGIPTVGLIDTDSDPDLVAIPIPGNDDASRCIDIVMTQLVDAVLEGVAGRVEGAEQGETPAAAARRRSRRPTTARADEAVAVAQPGAPLGEVALGEPDAGLPSSDPTSSGSLSPEAEPPGLDAAPAGQTQQPDDDELPSQTT